MHWNVIIIRNTLLLFNHWWLSTTHLKVLLHIMFSWVGAVISHDNSIGYRCCIARSNYDFLSLDLTSFTLQSLSGYTSVMILSFHCALFHPSPSITTTSPTLTSVSLLLCFKLCHSHNDVRYSFLNLFHALMNSSVVWPGSNGFLLLKCMQIVCLFFSLLYSSCDTWLNLQNLYQLLEKFFSCSSVWWKNVLLLSSEKCAMESFASKTISVYSLCYLSEFKNLVVFPDSSHC